MGLTPGFLGISMEDVQTLFWKTRKGETKPPYKMRGAEADFIESFLALASEIKSESVSTLEETLSLIWQEFVEEYQMVSMNDLDKRYSEFFWITH